MRAFRSPLTTIARLTSAVLLAACTTATDPEPIATISLVPGNDSIEVGQTYNGWVVTLKDAAGQTLTGRTLSWESNNPTSASVNASTGEVTGLVGGSGAIITVRAEGKSAQASIKVLIPIVNIVVNPDSFDLPMTTTRQLVATLVGPEGVAISNRTITWLSSNPGVAVVSATGLVTAVSLGTVTITVRAGLKEKQIRVRVVGEPVASVRITPQQTVHVVRLGQTYQLGAQCLNAQQQVMTGIPITWNSSNPVVATVSSSGLVSGNAVGSANITAACNNTVSPPVTAQVTPIPVSSVTISPNGLSLVFNTAGQLTATARDSANNVLSLQGRQVVWSSSNIPVATVSAQGVVQASNNNAGATQITVSVDGVVSAPVTVDVHAFLSAFSSPSKQPLGVWLGAVSSAAELPRH